MSSLEIAVQIAGAIAFLLFGLSQIRIGLQKALGFRMKLILAAGTRNSLWAFLSGLAATVGLQSSTATALLTGTFANDLMISSRMAQIAMLGANLGTALTAAFVFSGLAVLAPLFLLGGYTLSRRVSMAGVGTVLIGVGITFVSLELLGSSLEPLRTSAQLSQFLLLLGNAAPIALILAAGLAVLCASSLATVLLVATLGAPPVVTLAMVLGANLGGAILPVVAAGPSNDPARRLAIGNLLIRGIGCVLVLPFLNAIGPLADTLSVDAARLAVGSHIAFNLCLATVAWGFVGPITRLVARLFPDPAEVRSTWLDERLLSSAPLALAGAGREALVVGDLADRMLRQAHIAFRTRDPVLLMETAALERQIDRSQQDIKNYLSQLEVEGRAGGVHGSERIFSYVINLEHIGDIIDKGIVPAIKRMIELGLQFSEEGRQELDRLFQMTLENLHMAQTVFMTSDRQIAEMLVESKVDVRRFEQVSAQRHLSRYCKGRPESRDTSPLHLDLLRDLKRINAHAVAVALPILQNEGMLVESRLVEGTAG